LKITPNIKPALVAGFAFLGLAGLQKVDRHDAGANRLRNLRVCLLFVSRSRRISQKHRNGSVPGLRRRNEGRPKAAPERHSAVSGHLKLVGLASDSTMRSPSAGTAAVRPDSTDRRVRWQERKDSNLHLPVLETGALSQIELHSYARSYGCVQKRLSHRV
jgi:hypothetical protein